MKINKDKAMRDWDKFDTKEKIINKNRKNIKNKKTYTSHRNVFRRP